MWVAFKLLINILLLEDSCLIININKLIYQTYRGVPLIWAAYNYIFVIYNGSISFFVAIQFKKDFRESLDCLFWNFCVDVDLVWFVDLEFRKKLCRIYTFAYPPGPPPPHNGVNSGHCIQRHIAHALRSDQ